MIAEREESGGNKRTGDAFGFIVFAPDRSFTGTDGFGACGASYFALVRYHVHVGLTTAVRVILY